MLTILFGNLSATVLLLAGLVHAYWAFGGQRLKLAAIPQVKGKASFAPTVSGTLAVAVALIVASWQVAAQSGLVAGFVPAWITLWTCRLLAVVFLARTIGDFRLVGLFKTVKDSPFAHWDTRLYSPLCLFLALGCAAVSY